MANVIHSTTLSNTQAFWGLHGHCLNLHAPPPPSPTIQVWMFHFDWINHHAALSCVSSNFSVTILVLYRVYVLWSPPSVAVFQVSWQSQQIQSVWDTTWRLQRLVNEVSCYLPSMISSRSSQAIPSLGPRLSLKWNGRCVRGPQAWRIGDHCSLSLWDHLAPHFLFVVYRINLSFRKKVCLWEVCWFLMENEEQNL